VNLNTYPMHPEILITPGSVLMLHMKTSAHQLVAKVFSKEAVTFIEHRVDELVKLGEALPSKSGPLNHRTCCHWLEHDLERFGLTYQLQAACSNSCSSRLHASPNGLSGSS
jgi:hypothetical protein